MIDAQFPPDVLNSQPGVSQDVVYIKNISPKLTEKIVNDKEEQSSNILKLHLFLDVFTNIRFQFASKPYNYIRDRCGKVGVPTLRFINYASKL